MASEPLMLAKTQTIQPGESQRFGATYDGQGTNFALFSANAEQVELCLYDPTGQHEIGRYFLPGKTHDIWHGYLPDLAPGTCYGYRVYGPYEPHAGHRFNHHKLLLDPYARQLQGEFQWNDSHFGYNRDDPLQDLSFSTTDNAFWMPKGVVTTPQMRETASHSTWRAPWHRTHIYEAHVRGFTMLHPDVPESLRGSFDGMSQPEVIDYLKSLGITSVELMPVQAFIDEHFLDQKDLGNYWGYNSLNFFAPHDRYLSSGQAEEFRQMVDRFHDAGLEVILDVVYNHTAESNQLGPTLSFRGIDNASYYWLQPDDNRFYVNDTGCGNTLNINHPRVLQMVMDSLRYWATEMQVDGFRFDLATIMGREKGGFNRQNSFFQAVAQDPQLAGKKLIAEPWDIGPGGYQLGGFPAGWSEWNDRYRDTMRRFWRGDAGVMPEFSRRLHGSSDIFEHTDRSPSASVNYVASHDGFTLSDLVSYKSRHNIENGEDNRDGHQENLSDNFGCEGPSDDAAVEAMRLRQQKNYLLTLLVSQGVPMLQAGDELGRTQRGNNNAYCQDNSINWIDWSSENQELQVFTRQLFSLRSQFPILQHSQYIHVSEGSSEPNIYWLNRDGQEMRKEHWHEHNNHLLGYLLAGPEEGGADAVNQILVIFNNGKMSDSFCVPSACNHRRWRLLLNSSEDELENTTCLPEDGEVIEMNAQSSRIYCAEAIKNKGNK